MQGVPLQTHLNSRPVNVTASIPFIKYGSQNRFDSNPRPWRRRHFPPEFSPLQRVVGRLHCSEWSFRGLMGKNEIRCVCPRSCTQKPNA